MTKRADLEKGAVWKTVPCWHNCGGRCVIKVLVKDGKVLRTKTDDAHPDSWELPQNRACAMGYAMHQQVFGEDRLKYPMKRKHWSLEEPNGHLRGIDEWERISWDEALDYTAAAIKKSREKYGNRSVLYMNMVNMEGYLGQVLAASGGFVDCTGSSSVGTFALNTGTFGMSVDNGNDRMDLANSEYIVLYGHNAAWCAFGNPSYYLKHAKEAGSKFVFVGPDYPATAGFTNAEWIPVRPGTDTAFLLGVSYSMVTRDKDGSHVDWDALAKYTVGFDSAHMPANASTDESFMDYLMGRSDGIPKSQQWASEICGTPIDLIDRFADIMSCKNNTSIHCNGAPARNKGAENLPQMLMTVSVMGHHFGRPGNSFSNDQYYGAFNNGGGVANMAPAGAPALMTNAGNPIDDILSQEFIWDAIVDGKYTYVGGCLPFQPVAAPEQRDLDVHVIISEQFNLLSSMPNTNKGIEAFRKVDFVSAQAYFLKTDAQFADIVFPITTRWEHNGGNVYFGFKDKESVFVANQSVLNAPYETRPDIEVARGLAERLGLDYDELNPMPDADRWMSQIAMANLTVPSEQQSAAEQVGRAGEGEEMGNDFIAFNGAGGKPIANITQEDLDKWGVEYVPPQEGLIDLDELLDNGCYRQRRAEGDDYVAIGYKAFHDDPEGHPLPTASGKFEIYSQAKSDYYDLINGYSNGGSGLADYVRVSPLPKYLEAPFSYKDSFADWENKVRGPYPIQPTSLHYLRRAHTDCDNLPWLREAFTNPIFVNKQDAAERGIKNGDIIRVFNDYGEFIRPAAVVRTVMPGVILVPHGANARFDRETGMEMAGADNVLTPSNRSTTPYLNGWNTNLCQYEKYDGPIDLVPDCEMPQIIPIAD